MAIAGEASGDRDPDVDIAEAMIKPTLKLLSRTDIVRLIWFSVRHHKRRRKTAKGFAIYADRPPDDQALERLRTVGQARVRQIMVNPRPAIVPAQGE